MFVVYTHSRSQIIATVCGESLYVYLYYIELKGQLAFEDVLASGPVAANAQVRRLDDAPLLVVALQSDVLERGAERLARVGLVDGYHQIDAVLGQVAEDALVARLAHNDRQVVRVEEVLAKRYHKVFNENLFRKKSQLLELTNV